jgi:hypothetical protein
VRRYVVVDGESSGTSSVSWGGFNQRRLLRQLKDSGGEIGRRWWAMCSGEWMRRGCDERGGWWCEENERGAAPFIAAEGGRGSAVKSSMATSLQGRGVAGDDAAGLARSWW